MLRQPCCCSVLAVAQYNLLGVMDEEKIRLREEVQEQIKALQELKQMAAAYGDDVSRPATNSREAVQVMVAVVLLLTVLVSPECSF
jgi:pyruvate-formate lyase